MMKTRLHFLLLFLLLLGMLFPGWVPATHTTGQEMTYSCNNGCEYTIFQRGYRHCSGINAYSLSNIQFVPLGSNCGTPTIVPGQDWPLNDIQTEITPLCPGAVSRCNGGQVSGIVEHLTYATYDFCSTSCAFTVSWQSCCRNNAITSGAGSNQMASTRTLITPNLSGCNSSPQFNQPPPEWIYLGETAHIDLGATDPDGDSLAFALGACEAAGGDSVTYNPGYSPNAPLTNSWNLQLDSRTGQLTCIPNPGGFEVGVVCVQVKEYRNGQQIGEIWRDFQLPVVSFPSSPPSLFPLTLQSSVGTVNGRQVSGLVVGDTMNLSFTASDPDAGEIVSAYLITKPTGLNLIDNGNGQATDTLTGSQISGTLNWVPTVPGQYFVSLNLDDNACPVFTETQTVILLEVENSGLQVQTSEINCLRHQFDAIPLGGTGPYTYQWSGTGGLNFNPNNNSSSFSHLYPGAGTYSWSVSVTDTSGYQETQNGVVSITTLQTSSLFGNYPPLNCGGDSLLLSPGNGYSNYQWDDGSTNPERMIFTPGTYSVVVDDYNGCQFTDSVTIQDSAFAPISGTVYADGIVAGQMTVNLLRYVSADSSFAISQSTTTDNQGQFQFDCPKTNEEYRISVNQNPAQYPNKTITYADSGLVWQDSPALFPNQPNQTDIHLRSYTMNQGSKSLSGTVLDETGQPVPGLRLLVVDAQNQLILDDSTNAQGHFQFNNLPSEAVSVWVDKPQVDNGLARILPLPDATHNFNQLSCTLHPTWLEIPLILSAPKPQPGNLKIFPNPNTGRFRISFSNDFPGPVELQILDIQGRKVSEEKLDAVAGMNWEVDLSRKVKAGIFFLKIKSEVGVSCHKVVIQ